MIGTSRSIGFLNRNEKEHRLRIAAGSAAIVALLLGMAPLTYSKKLFGKSEESVGQPVEVLLPAASKHRNVVQRKNYFRHPHTRMSLVYRAR